jgi:hypothetical protein
LWPKWLCRHEGTDAQWLAASLASHGEEITVAVVIACIALALAIIVVFASLVFVQRHRQALRADFTREVKEAHKKFCLQLEQMKVSQGNLDEAVKSYSTLRDRANAQFVTADTDASRTERRLNELERFTLRTLDYRATTGAKPLILRGGLYVQQIPVLDIVLELVDRFLVALGADLMYRQDDGADGSKFYLRWPLDKTPKDVLDSLTRAVAGPCSCGGGVWSGCSGSSSGCPGRSSASPGAAELQAVLEALRDGGLGVLHLGPLILLRTKTCIQAGFLAPSFRWLTEDQKRKAVNIPEPDKPSLMAELGVAVFLEFRQ